MRAYNEYGRRFMAELRQCVQKTDFLIRGTNGGTRGGDTQEAQVAGHQLFPHPRFVLEDRDGDGAKDPLRRQGKGSPSASEGRVNRSSPKSKPFGRRVELGLVKRINRDESSPKQENKSQEVLRWMIRNPEETSDRVSPGNDRDSKLLCDIKFLPSADSESEPKSPLILASRRPGDDASSSGSEGSPKSGHEKEAIPEPPEPKKQIKSESVATSTDPRLSPFAEKVESDIPAENQTDKIDHEWASDSDNGNPKKWVRDVLPIDPLSSESDDMNMDQDEDALRDDTSSCESDSSSEVNSSSSEFAQVFRTEESDSDDSDDSFEVVTTLRTREDEIRQNRQRDMMMVTGEA
jgi:hypothetical protein